VGLEGVEGMDLPALTGVGLGYRAPISASCFYTGYEVDFMR